VFSMDGRARPSPLCLSGSLGRPFFESWLLLPCFRACWPIWLRAGTS
jgi:hypothetical protein